MDRRSKNELKNEKIIMATYGVLHIQNVINNNLHTSKAYHSVFEEQSQQMPLTI